MTRRQRKVALDILGRLKVLKIKCPAWAEEDIQSIIYDLDRVLRQDHGNRMPDAIKQLTLEFYKAGVPLKSIMHDLDVSDEFIRRELKRAGVPRRNNYPATRAPRK